MSLLALIMSMTIDIHGNCCSLTPIPFFALEHQLLAHLTTSYIHCRARLVATDRGQQAEPSTSKTQGQWAHDLSKPEKGCLLLAHPLMFGNSQAYFSQVLAAGRVIGAMSMLPACPFCAFPAEA